MKQYKFIKQLIIWVVFFVVYFILFDFIIPVNKYFPKLSLIYEAGLEIIKHYNLFSGITITTSIIYFPLSVILLLLYYNINFSFIFKVSNFIKIPFFLIILIFGFWFNNSIFAELIFAFIIILIHISYKARNLLKKESNNYVEFIKINKLSDKTLGKVNFIIIKSGLLHEMRKTHFYLWTFILFYEFINKTGGIGNIVQHIFNNIDLSGMFAISFIIFVLISIGDYIYLVIKNKILI